MSLNAGKIKHENQGPKQEPLEAGNYPARVVQIIDLGLQPQQPYQGQEKAPAHEIMLTYEFGTEFIKDEEGNEVKDKPRWLSETFPIRKYPEADKAKSTKRIDAIDPKGAHKGNFAAFVEAPVTVTVVNNVSKKTGTVYNNVGNVTPPMKGMVIPELVNPPKVFDLDEPDLEIFGSLPQWLQDKIKENLTYQGSKLQRKLEGNVAAQDDNEQEEENDKDW